MKVITILVVVTNVCVAQHVNRRISNDVENTTESLQINVSAGYGVHSDNTSQGELQERKSIAESPPKTEIQDKAYEQPRPVERPGPRSRAPQISPQIRIPAGTKLIEVLKVPAMYELHLQSDPQRIVSINPQWAHKINSAMEQRFRRPPPQMHPRPQRPLNPNYAGAGYQQIAASNTIPNLKPKPVKIPRKITPIPRTSYQKSYATSYQNYHRHSTYQAPTESPQKFIEFTTSVPINEASAANYYQKPQAIHEVPAPALNNGQKSKVGDLVYGKSNYKPGTRNQVSGPPEPQIVTSSNSWNNNQEQRPVYYPEPEPEYQEPHYEEPHNQEPNYQEPRYQEPQYQEPRYQEPQYQEQKKSQNHYNEAFGDYLDQNLANVNGNVPSYVNNDGTLTVSNFHHNPTLYTNPNGYDVTETTTDDAPNYQPEHYNNYNNEYSQSIPENYGYEDHYDPQSQGFADQNNEVNRIVDEGQKQKFEPMGVYDRGIVHRRYHNQRYPQRAQRRMYQPPLDYIVYITEQSFD